jgi:hypothetical protein
MGNLIGGTAPGARNLISGNGGNGITITSPNEIALELAPAGGNTIQGNYIGTDVTGTQALANDTGIVIIPGRSAVGNTLIGGTEAGAGNVTVQQNLEKLGQLCAPAFASMAAWTLLSAVAAVSAMLASPSWSASWPSCNTAWPNKRPSSAN